MRSAVVGCRIRSPQGGPDRVSRRGYLLAQRPGGCGLRWKCERSIHNEDSNSMNLSRTVRGNRVIGSLLAPRGRTVTV